MYKGKIKNIIGSGAAFISSSELDDDIYCNKRFVEQHSLQSQDLVEFECKMGFKNLEVTNIKKLEKPNPAFENALIIDKLNANEYDIFCNSIKEYVNQKNFKDNVTTSKIRNIYSELLRAKTEKDVKMLRPKLAYLAGRDNKTRFFMNDLDKLIQKIDSEENVISFKQFFEAIICYKKEIER